MKIASWNVNSLNVRLPHVLRWLESSGTDVLALQETKVPDERFPQDAFTAITRDVAFSGQKTYNGVATIANTAQSDVITDPDSVPDEQRRILASTVNGVRIINLYVVNGKAVGDEKYIYKLDWLQRVTRFIAAELARYPQLVVLGDFNIAPDARDVYDPDVWHDGTILCSQAEREALAAIKALGLHDSFRLLHDDAGHYSWWDYRQAAFRRDMGLRIDLILVSDALRDKVVQADIDREPRTWERPSDHTPVSVELAL